jgi:pimeloyl-[acyl-carrier protein] methyl ester esterase
MVKLVLLPGLDGTGILFKPFLAFLSEDIDPVVVSYPTDAKLGYDELLPLVLDRLPTGPFVLLGESFAGPLAVMAADREPVGLRGVVLCASFVRSPVAYLPPWCSYLVRPFQFRILPPVVRARLLSGRFSDVELRRLIAQAAGQVRPEVIAHRIRAVHRVDVASELARCSVPVLYLRGTRDRVVPASAMRVCLRANATIRCVSLMAPHTVLQTQPAAAARVIYDFINSTSKA